MINIEVYSTHAVIRSQQPLTVGLTGAKAHFTFGEPWAELTKTAVFRQGEKTVTVVDIGKQVEIPWEVLTLPGVPVMIGIYGTDAEEKLVIPTVWAETEPVRPGTDPDQGASPAEPTPSVWEQLQGHMGSLEQLQTNDKTSLAAAINEANRAVLAVTVSGADGSYETKITMAELSAALDAGKNPLCYWEDHRVWLPLAKLYIRENGISFADFSLTAKNKEYYIHMTSVSGGDMEVTGSITVLATENSKLPNPEKLTLVGNTTAEYDGSEAVTVDIPTKVSQLENDSGFLTEVPVTSVNGQTGAVTVDIPTKVSQLQNDSGFLTEETAPVTSVNGQTGAVTVDIPTKVSQLQNDSGFLTEETAPVTSVNGQTGAVTVDIPTKVSQLQNDSGFLTEETAPVTSVNGQTGAVTVDIPTKVSQLQNDRNFLTEAPVTSVNGQTGDVTLPTTLMVTVTKQADGSYVSDKTVAELRTALNAGETLRCWYYDDDAYLPLTYCHGGFTFSAAVNQYLYQLTIYLEGTETKILFTKTELSSGDGGADGLLFDQATGTLYLLQNGQILGNGVQLPAAEGGSTNNAVLTLENTTDWSVKTILIDSACPVSFQWSSIEDGISTGPGTMVVKVGGVIRYSAAVKQGKHALDISQYLSRGENLIHVSVTDFYGNSQTITLGVTVVDPDALISTKLVERTLTGDYTNDRVTKIGPEAFAGLTLGRLSLPNVTGDITQAFADLVADEVESPSVASTGYKMVNGSTIGVLRLPNVTTTRSDEDFRAKRVERVVFDRLEVWNKSLRGMYLQVVTFDFHNLKSLPNLPSGGLLSNLIIRTPDVCTLGSAPESTTAKLFVPDDLLADYKSNTNWGVMADRIFAIEDITVDGTVTGEPDSKKMEDIGNV